MKILCLGDIHGRHEAFTNAIHKFETEGYDKLIQIGDLADSWDRTDEDILRCFKIAVDAKETHGDNYIQLMGNHDLQYMITNQYCSGHRVSLSIVLVPYLQEHHKIFQTAYQVGNYLFTHAGVTKGWFTKHELTYARYHSILGIDNGNIASTLNAIAETKDRDILYEVGSTSGGYRYDIAGPLWARPEDIDKYDPLPGYHQIVGHTSHSYIQRVEDFGGSKFNNTSVTYIDVLDSKEQFLTINT